MQENSALLTKPHYATAVNNLIKKIAKKKCPIDHPIISSLGGNLASFTIAVFSFYSQVAVAKKFLREMTGGQDAPWQSVAANVSVWPSILFSFINLSRHFQFMQRDPQRYKARFYKHKLCLLLTFLTLPVSIYLSAESLETGENKGFLFLSLTMSAITSLSTNLNALYVVRKDTHSDVIALEEAFDALILHYQQDPTVHEDVLSALMRPYSLEEGVSLRPDYLTEFDNFSKLRKWVLAQDILNEVEEPALFSNECFKGALLSLCILGGIMKFSYPILQIVYPALIMLSIVNILYKLFGMPWVKTPVYATAAAALLIRLMV